MVSFDTVMKEAENIPLGISDLLILTDNKCDIHVYSDLKKFKTLDDMLGKHKSSIILYQLADFNTGHWIAVYKEKNTIYYIDSYGQKLDVDIKISPYLRDVEGELDRKEPHLTALINADRRKGFKFFENRFRFQALKQNVNTCGRFASIFIVLKHIDFKEVVNLFKRNKNNSDMIVTYLTYLSVRNRIVKDAEKKSGLHADVQRELDILKIV